MLSQATEFVKTREIKVPFSIDRKIVRLNSLEYDFLINPKIPCSLPTAKLLLVVEKAKGLVVPSYGNLFVAPFTVAYGFHEGMWIKSLKPLSPLPSQQFNQKVALHVNDWLSAMYFISEGFSNAPQPYFLFIERIGGMISACGVVFELLNLKLPASFSEGEKKSIISLVEDFHNAFPCIHGDLHRGNVGIANGKPMLFDYEYAGEASRDKQVEEKAKLKNQLFDSHTFG